MGDDISQKPPSDKALALAPHSDETYEQRLARIRIFDRESVSGQYCGFVDILGFGDATQNDLPSVLSLYEELLDKTEWLQASRPPVRVSVYSDSFVLISPDLAPLIMCVRSLQFHLLFENCLFRGALAYGDHAEGEKAGARFIISAGVSKAAALEKKIKWPCVALHPDLEIPDYAWADPNRYLLYFDGLRIVNPFNVMWYRSAGNRVRQMAKEHPEHIEKYDWFMRLFEAVAEEPLIPEDVLERLKASYGFDGSRPSEK
jgi:hypothetical protein